jgi:hypothetical protein
MSVVASSVRCRPGAARRVPTERQKRLVARRRSAGGLPGATKRGCSGLWTSIAGKTSGHFIPCHARAGMNRAPAGGPSRIRGPMPPRFRRIRRLFAPFVASGRPSVAARAQRIGRREGRQHGPRADPDPKPHRRPIRPDSARFGTFRAACCTRKTECRAAASADPPARRDGPLSTRLGTNVAGRRTTSRFGPNQGLWRVEIHRIVRGSVARASD